jgi:hypothetical protein
MVFGIRAWRVHGTVWKDDRTGGRLAPTPSMVGQLRSGGRGSIDQGGRTRELGVAGGTRFRRRKKNREQYCGALPNRELTA